MQTALNSREERASPWPEEMAVPAMGRAVKEELMIGQGVVALN